MKKSKKDIIISDKKPEPELLILRDVTEIPDKLAKAQTLMKPIATDVDISSELTIVDMHFTQQIFAEAYFNHAGETYEREAIARWLETHNTNPTDNTKLQNKELRPNMVTLRQVNHFLDKNPLLRDSDELYLPRGWVQEMLNACIEGGLDKIAELGHRDPRLLSWTFNFEEKQYEAWQGKTMLHLVCAKAGPEAIIKLLTLVEKRAEGLALLLLLKKDSTGKLPIQYAMQPDGDSRLLYLLAAQMGKHLVSVEPVAWPTPKGQKPRQMTALHLAAMINHPGVIKTLVDDKADITAEDGLGNTPLHYAMLYSAIQAVKVLMVSGAFPEVENDIGQTPQTLGSTHNQTEAVSVLQSLIAQRTAAQQQQQWEQLGNNAGPLLLALLQQMQEKLNILSKELSRSNQEVLRLRGHVEQLPSKNPEKTVWKSMKHAYRKTPPKELRQMVIDELPSFPEVRQAQLFVMNEFVRNKEIFATYAGLRIKLGEINALVRLPPSSLVSARDNGIMFWDSKDQYTFAESKGVLALTVLTSGYVVGGLENGSIKIWNVEGKCITTLEEHKKPVLTVVGLPKNQFASGSADKTIKIWQWDGRNATHITTFTQEDYIRVLAVLPDGNLVSGSDDSSIRIWNIEQGVCTATLEGHYSWVQALLALPDGKLVSGDSNGLIKIWNAQGACLATLKGHQKSVRALALLPNGLIASSSDDGSIKIWDGAACINTYEQYGIGAAIVILPDGIPLVAKGKNIKFLFKPITLDLSFQSSLRVARAQLYTTQRTLRVATALPCEAGLKAMVATLQTLCPEVELKHTVTSTELCITGVTDKSLLTQLEGLCEVFSAWVSAKPALTPTLADSSSSLFYHAPSKTQDSSQSGVPQLELKNNRY